MTPHVRELNKKYLSGFDCEFSLLKTGLAKKTDKNPKNWVDWETKQIPWKLRKILQTEKNS